MLDDAARLASSADRLIVLANPVILDQAEPTAALPASVLVDSGGAPLSVAGISDFRARGVDVREGYGLTETASLTHFDTEATGVPARSAPRCRARTPPSPPATVSRSSSCPDLLPGFRSTQARQFPPGACAPPILARATVTADCGCSAGPMTSRSAACGPGTPSTPSVPCWDAGAHSSRHQHGRAAVRLLTGLTPAAEAALRARAADLLDIPPGDVAHHRPRRRAAPALGKAHPPRPRERNASLMTTVRVLTWNVWGKNADWRAREDALLAAMADVDADIVTVQEAWTEPSGSTQTARLAAALGFAHHHQADTAAAPSATASSAYSPGGPSPVTTPSP